MTTVPELFAAAAALATLLGFIAVWAPRRLLVKVVAVLAVAGFLPLGYLALVELLSRPKPVALEWWLAQAEEATVLGSLMKEGEGIYLWLQLAEAEQPRAYVLPWNRRLAEQLQKAREEAEEQQTELRMRLPFEPSLDDREPKFYALPQPALPPKDLLPGAPEIYDHPGADV